MLSLGPPLIEENSVLFKLMLIEANYKGQGL